ncbi:hypothetical protein NDR89_15545 [Cupriavidus gilardii]|uniref:Uncharacterized protein n=1 Tax=Cupriavidus gilardii TaxID=82541 RepID=A0ABY4VVI0_9BURK|nr:hypothetical protein [Cupriavidus gilardii]USE81133.1 hypothetical protein NDR89_15545 [Cupriavidus gilardii]
MQPDLTTRTVSVSEALDMEHRLSANGWQRIICALRICASDGLLHPDDAKAFREWEAGDVRD